jgi:hypothetical protein
VLDIGINVFAVQTWVAVALVAMWTAFVAFGLLALDRQDTADVQQAASNGSSKQKTSLKMGLAHSIHQVLFCSRKQHVVECCRG